MLLRTYQPSDKEELLLLLRSNTPEFFDPEEEKAYDNYLDTEVEDYFLIETEGRIAGAGGINYFPDHKTARLSWDLVTPDLQGKGIGTKLIRYRLDRLREDASIDRIEVRTSQLTYGFYAKMGFRVEKVVADFWAKGYHLYQMRFFGDH